MTQPSALPQSASSLRAALDADFLQPKHTIAGIPLYDFSAGIMTACRKIGLKLMVGSEEEKKAMTQAEQLADLMVIFWMMAHPPEVITTAIADPDFRVKYIEPFEFRVPVGAIGDFAKLIKGDIDRANAADVETVAKPVDGDHVGPQPPPNS